MKSRKKQIPKAVRARDFVFGDGNKLTEKEKKEMDQAVAKHRLQSKTKNAA